jgi:hypothetical protein
VEYARTATSIERLDDHLSTELTHEGLQPGDLTSDHRGRNHSGEIERVQLLVGFPQTAGIIEDKRSGRRRHTQQIGGEDVWKIDRRILAHEYRLEPVQGLGALFQELIVRVASPDRHPAESPPRATVRHEEIGEVAVVQRMSARLALKHEDEGRVLVRQYPLDRVHDEQEAIGHSVGMLRAEQCCKRRALPALFMIQDASG